MGLADWIHGASGGWNGGPNLGFGNAGRDIVVGPGRTNFGTNLYKSFAFTRAGTV